MTGGKGVREWWDENPMTYGDRHGGDTFDGAGAPRGTAAFFEKVDAQFYAWNAPLHGDSPFDRLFPYGDYGPGSRVLEIGCGMGTMAMNWAKRGVTMTAVDLNPTAVEQTSRRFALAGLRGDVLPCDARRLPFADGTFDYAYSWGVLHHSPGLEGSVAEMMRVLRPGGGFGLMLYNRRSLYHWYFTWYVEGFLHDERRFLDDLGLASRYGDGHLEEGNPHTWPVTPREIGAMVRPYSPDAATRVLGTDLDYLFTLMLPGLGMVLPRWAKKVWARRYGWSLWTAGHRG